MHETEGQRVRVSAVSEGIIVDGQWGRRGSSTTRPCHRLPSAPVKLGEEPEQQRLCNRGSALLAVYETWWSEVEAVVRGVERK